MACQRCKTRIKENEFSINCSNCGDFCSEDCFMGHHDEHNGCSK